MSYETPRDIELPLDMNPPDVEALRHEAELEHEAADTPGSGFEHPLGPPPRRWNWRVMVVIFVIVIPVLFGILLAWQYFTPPPAALIPSVLFALTV